MQALGKIMACFGLVLFACFATLLGVAAQATPEAGTALQAETVEVPVNVIICDDDSCLCLDAECASPRTLDGAVVTSFDANGTQIDACTVSSEFDDFDGCVLDILEDGSGLFEVAAPAGTEGYVLESLEPEYIGNLNLWLWSFIPDGAEPTAAPTEASATAEPAVESTAAPVTSLPETGAGHESGSQGALFILGIGGVVALAFAAMSGRLVRR